METTNNVPQVFQSEQFGSVRVVMIDGEPWFVGKDVADALGYSNPRDALAKHVDDEDKNTVAFCDGIRGNPNMTVINESGVYSLVFASKLPTAKQFKHWVTSEVLPSIRKTGGYTKGQESMSDLEFLARACLMSSKIIEKNNEQIRALSAKIEEDKPKVEFADAIATASNSILIGSFAKILKQKGIPTGQNRLFAWLRNNDYLIKRPGSEWNMPTQRAMEMGLFEIRESTSALPDNSTRIYKTTLITGKGQMYFMDLFTTNNQMEVRSDG